MKVVFTVASYYPLNDGVQYVTQYHAEGLVRMGHEVVVITSKRNDQDSFIHNGVKIICINAYNSHFFHSGNKNEFLGAVTENVENADVMINVCLQSYAADWVLPLLDKIKAKRILYMHGMHSFKWEKKDFSNIKSFILKLARDIRWKPFYIMNWDKIKKYDAVIHLHELDYAFRYFENNGYKNNFVIYNAVDTVFFEEHKKSNIVINVGSFNERKNQKKAIELFYRAKTNDYSLVIIGNPNNEYYQMLLEYKNQCEKTFGHKEVKILCSISREETIAYIQKAKIYLMTSTWEAFPISLIEAMAARMAFISTNVGIVSSLPGGVVCDSDTELIATIEKLVNDECEDSLASEAYSFAKMNLYQDNQTKKLETLIKDLTTEVP